MWAFAQMNARQLGDPSTGSGSPAGDSYIEPLSPYLIKNLVYFDARSQGGSSCGQQECKQESRAAGRYLMRPSCVYLSKYTLAHEQCQLDRCEELGVAERFQWNVKRLVE